MSHRVSTSHTRAKGDPAYFDTQAQAASALRISLETLRKAKRDGCPAFKSGRIYKAPLHAWLARADTTNTVAPDIDWKKLREKLEAQRLERKILREDGQLYLATETDVVLGQLLTAIQTALSMLPATAARFLVGLRDVHQVQSRLQGEIDAILTQLNLALYLDDILLEFPAEHRPHIAAAFALVGRRALPVTAAAAPAAPPDPPAGADSIPPAPPPATAASPPASAPPSRDKRAARNSPSANAKTTAPASRKDPRVAPVKATSPQPAKSTKASR